MKKLKVPAYDWKVVKELKRYALNTKAKDPWGHGKEASKTFKRKLTALMLVEQSKRCGYCGCRLFEKRPHRDHIAPKEIYKQWMFWPENLVLSCFTCNTDLKKSFDPVVAVGRTYRSTDFSFVHPYIDTPSDHLAFTSERLELLIQAKNGSLKGGKTIEIFDLASAERSKQRAKDLMFDDDLEYLQGDYRDLFENAVEAIHAKFIKVRARFPRIGD